jgi:DNA-binding CsgD family transcriptional regulator
MFVSVTTVKSHLMHTFRKLSVERRSQLRAALDALSSRNSISSTQTPYDSV